LGGAEHGRILIFLSAFFSLVLIAYVAMHFTLLIDQLVFTPAPPTEFEKGIAARLLGRSER
jgi:CBS domain containing-hemolysin-like protein